jgi:glycosyltransferase involved in cell wall biosynthesis
MAESQKSSSADISGIPESLKEMAAEAGPVRILMVDVDAPLPILKTDSRYKSAWVIFCKSGVPRSMVTLDLSGSNGSPIDNLRDQLELKTQSFSAIQQAAVVPDSELPKISVVIPTILSRIEELGTCIDSLGDLDYPDFEVVVVDNRSSTTESDPLPGLVSGREWLRVVRERRPGISAARNAGAAAAVSAIVAFTDDDVRVDPQWLRAIGSRFSLNPDIGAVTGLILPAELETPAQIWFERYFGGFGSQRNYAPVTLEADPSGPGYLRGSRVLVRDTSGEELRRFSVYGIGAYGAGANMAFRKSALGRIGGFDCTLGVGTPSAGGEDLVALIELLWIGVQVGYDPAAFVWHRHRREYKELLKQIDGYATGYVAMLVALMSKDIRHIPSIAYQLPFALRCKVVQGMQRLMGNKSAQTDAVSATRLYPSSLYKTEALAYLRGPVAFWRSKLRWKEIEFSKVSAK